MTNGKKYVTENAGAVAFNIANENIVCSFFDCANCPVKDKNLAHFERCSRELLKWWCKEI